MKLESPELHVPEVVRAFHASGAPTLYGAWRWENKRKTFSLHMTEPTDTLRPSELVFEISDGRRFVVDQPTSYEERHGEHGKAWSQVYGRPTLRTPNGPRSSIPFIVEADGEAADPPKPGKWWQ